MSLEHGLYLHLILLLLLYVFLHFQQGILPMFLSKVNFIH